MMSRVRATAMVVTAASMLLPLPAVAQDTPATPLGSAHFTAEIVLAASDYRPGTSVDVPGGRDVSGETVVDREFIASDARISGQLSTVSDIAFRFIPDGEVLSSAGRAEIVNADGSWIGTLRSISWQRGMRVFASDFVELRGFGAYDGLSAVFTIDLRADPQVRGAIFEGTSPGLADIAPSARDVGDVPSS